MVSSCASTDIKIERDFGFSISFVNSSFSIPSFSSTTIVFLVMATSFESSRAIFDVRMSISKQTHVHEELSVCSTYDLSKIQTSAKSPDLEGDRNETSPCLAQVANIGVFSHFEVVTQSIEKYRFAEKNL